MPTPNGDARITLRLSSELKKAIEDAATELGQTVSNFAISTLVRTARKVLNDHQVTRLSERDWELFAARLDDALSKPNEALVKAAGMYKQRVG